MFKLTIEDIKNIKLGELFYGCEIESMLLVAENKAETIEVLLAGYIMPQLKEDLKTINGKI